jgi:hypothetical protein
MSEARLAQLVKRNRQLTALIQQRELTQTEKDEWEGLVREIQELQEGDQPEANSE